MRFLIGKTFCHIVSLLVVSSFLAPLLSVAGNKLSGNAALNVDAENKDSTEVDMVAELKLKTKRKWGFRAHIEGEGSAVKRDVHFEDVYIDYKFSERLQATLGYSKKILGLEYENSKKQRLTIHRSPIYQKMEALGLVGRQLNLRLNGKIGSKKDGTRISGALGGDNSRNYNIQLSVQKMKNHVGAGLWTLMEVHRIDNDFIPVFSEVLSLWYQSTYARIALEMIHGVDAHRTEFQKYLGNDRLVHFLSPKIEGALHCHLAEKMTLSPLVQAGLIFEDVVHGRQNTILALVGIRFKWHGLAVAFNAETYGVKDIADSNIRAFERRSVYGQIIYFF